MKKSIKYSLGITGTFAVAALVIWGAFTLHELEGQEKPAMPEEVASVEAIDLTNRPTYDNRAEFDAEKTISSGLSLSMVTSNYKDPAKLQEDSDYIAIVFIDSVDGADNYSEVTGDETLVTSFGKMTILESLKGDLEPGSIKVFYRVGGVMDFDQYCEHANRAHCDKLRYLDPERSVISESLLQDINFEVGTTYLAYLRKDESFRAGEGYTFIGFEGGTREVQTASTYTLNSASSDLKVLNNFTGEWENLGDVVKQDK